MHAFPPTFVLSLDTELLWGSFDHTSDEAFAASHPNLRGVTGDILSLLEEFDVSATWAVVGHLFLASCERGPDGRAHPTLARPAPSPSFPTDWFARDPCAGRDQAPFWYGDDLLDLIASCRVPQEIGSHSFSHMSFGPGCPAEAAESDVAECVRLATARGIELRSFVFPRNVVGRVDVLARRGFTSFRGEDPTWYQPLRGTAKRVARLLDLAFCMTPPVTVPIEVVPGVYDIKGSMLLLYRVGPYRAVLVRARIAKARRGLRRAVERGGVFHLWTHPENFAADRQAMLAALRGILVEVAGRRDRGELRVMTMGQLARAMPSRHEATLTTARALGQPRN